MSRHLYVQLTTVAALLMASTIQITTARELPEATLETIAKWPSQAPFTAFLPSLFEKFNIKPLNYEYPASLVIVPVAELPANTTAELSGGADIGILYLSSGSTSLGLEPGAYIIHVVFNKNTFTWQVNLLDESSNIIKNVPAAVEITTSTPRLPVIAYVDYSRCVRGGLWQVCF